MILKKKRVGKKRTFKVSQEQREATTPRNVNLRALGIERDEITATDFLKSVKDHKYAAKSKYQEDKFIKLLFEVFNNGDGVEAFCAAALISQETFYQWVKTHENFREAYKIVINIGATKWMRYPLIKPDINFLYWKTVASSRYGMNKIPVPFLQDKETEQTTIGRLNIAWAALIQEGINKGELSEEQLDRLIKIVLAQVAVENKGESPQDTTIVRQNREELVETVLAFNRAYEYKKAEEDAATANNEKEMKGEFVPGVI